MIPEARMETTQYGSTPATDGWFVVNVRDAGWVRNEKFGDACVIEGDEVSFGQIGYTLAVLAPGQPSGMYHREVNQEDFLVLAGECLLLVEGEERSLKAWDFVHCPPWTEHIFVGAGDGPCAIFMAGARTVAGPPREQPAGGLVYPVADVALRHGAGVETEAYHGSVAYAPFPQWLPGRPQSFAGLPWA